MNNDSKNRFKLSASLIFSSLVYFVLISSSIGLLYLFKPFTFVDNDKSKIVCNKSGSSFDIGPNYIYTFENTLDDFNDKKARKLCEFGIIRDYQDTYKIPESVNYDFSPSYAKDSSWGDAIIMSVFLFFLGGLLMGELRKTNLVLLLIPAVAAGFFFFLFLRKPLAKLYCTRQIARKVVNFRNSAFKYGVIKVPEEDKYINTLVPQLYQKCLKNEGF